MNTYDTTIEFDYVIFNITKQFSKEHKNITPINLFWEINFEKIKKYKYALGTIDNVVVEVMAFDKFKMPEIGNYYGKIKNYLKIAPKDILNLFLHKKVPEIYCSQKNQIKFINAYINNFNEKEATHTPQPLTQTQFSNCEFIDKIKNISYPPIKSSIGLLPNGSNSTLQEFFDEFIKPRLPKEYVIKAWHNVLMKYVSDLSNLTCCVRYGNHGNNSISEYGEKDYYKLRRGWITHNKDDDFEYYFTDNAITWSIYKLAIDGVIPTLNELSTAFRNHQFPCAWKYDNKINEYKGCQAALIKSAPFLGEYKVSHIFDAGKNFYVNGKQRGDAELSRIYYNIGHSNDFLQNVDKIRTISINEQTKKVIVAKFLRLVHPFNYFLTPAKKYHTCGDNISVKDIGEYTLLINYMRQYIKTTYPEEYKQFLLQIMWYDQVPFICPNGNEIIEIKYGKTNIIKPVKTPKPIMNPIVNDKPNQISHSKDKKTKAIRMFKELGYTLNSKFTTFASKNNGMENYWANPDIRLLSNDWYLILNDWISKKLYLFFIPSNSIKNGILKMRNDQPNKIDLQIYYNDTSFTDSRSNYSFSEYKIKEIDY